MKISSGSLRGMRIIMPKNEITRPTLSKVREAVFNILGNDLNDHVFWDLFSGSGAIGLTALSLGARECVFVEHERHAIQALRENMEEAKKRFLSNNETPAQMTLIPGEFSKAWKRIVLTTSPDVVWADPPYKETVKWAQFLKKELPAFVKPQTLLIMEMQSDDLEAAEKEQFLIDPQWETVKTRKYGGSSLVIWRKV